MGRVKTIARRSFLIGSAAVLGGVAFGTYMYKREVDNPLEQGLADGEVTFNPYVRIDANAVTLITPRADVGQGAYSIQAHLIAEELDVDLDAVRIEPGPPSAAYYNGVVAAEGMPIAATSETFLARTGRGASDVVGKLMGLQITGGSTTVPDMYDRLRMAGAVARETLITAAAQQTGLERSTLKTANGAVILPDGTSLSYVDLAGTAAEMPVSDEVALRDPSTWRHLGKPHMRTDIVAKSTGTQDYGIDMRMEGMVHATTRTNPALGGGINSFDASAAENMRGVRAVLPITGGIAVVADNTWRAFQAAQAVTCEWGPSPYIGETEKQFDEVASSFTEDRQDSRFKDEGDVEAALDGADVMEAEYRIPYLAHAPLEPMSVVVKLSDGRLDIWTGTQIPRFMQANAAKLTGLDADDVHVHVLMSGGSFGRRLEDDYVSQAVEIAMQIRDTPIQMVWQREEDMTHDFPRPLAIARMRGAASSDGIAAYDLSIAAPSVVASSMERLGQPAMGPDVAIVAGAWDQPFAIPDYRVTGYRVPPMVPISSWRSVGASGNGFLHECFVDEMCHAAGIDPLAERLRLCTHEPSRKVLEAVGDMSGWDMPLEEGRGRGLAFVLAFGVPVAQVVEVTDMENGIRIDKVFVAADVGRVLDPVNFEAQLSGGVIWGLGHAMNCEITYEGGVPQQDNYHVFEGMRLHQSPVVEVRGLENGDKIKGIGEPGVPPSAPALGNAIFAATGKRIRTLPFSNSVDFA
ncbi:Aldehyde oxidase and xanthine dehydrogenase, molybdopterin binding protein [Sulfitobacter noctilucicola]|uniref:Isoquinoline 1-oxidoreductase beta subunit n=1 Tax=Sulfitobacter noctilucicola TaxID=1342301 RepID=A0A7W6M966_9RHOB|nr:molybdopterin cofactor-binding domain-containing protein [Sulfitobacter noctilucicola]KIN64246.1 Aldehyde oxidase and xanthine dehydrogenase, molybdopterin binding protein [Sulfitobacter noctilucicola]MBB4174586.1 isoquinoline 1-oxidoreductase beta subunit [Sulfitobacter noctilucicola]